MYTHSASFVSMYRLKKNLFYIFVVDDFTKVESFAWRAKIYLQQDFSFTYSLVDPKRLLENLVCDCALYKLYIYPCLVLKLVCIVLCINSLSAKL